MGDRGKILLIIIGLFPCLAFPFQLPQCAHCNSDSHFTITNSGLVCNHNHETAVLSPWETINALVASDSASEPASATTALTVNPINGSVQILSGQIMQNLAAGGNTQTPAPSVLNQAAQMAMFHFILLSQFTPSERALTAHDKIRLWVLFRLWFNHLNGVENNDEEQKRLLELAEQGTPGSTQTSFSQLIKQQAYMNNQGTVHEQNHREAVLALADRISRINVGGYQIFKFCHYGALIAFRTGEQSYTLLAPGNQIVFTVDSNNLPAILQPLLFNEPFANLITIDAFWNQMSRLYQGGLWFTAGCIVGNALVQENCLPSQNGILPLLFGSAFSWFGHQSHQLLQFSAMALYFYWMITRTKNA